MKQKPLFVAGLALLAGGAAFVYSPEPLESPRSVTQRNVEEEAAAGISCHCGEKHDVACSVALEQKRQEAMKLAEAPVRDFRQWLQLTKGGELSDEQIQQGLKLAKARKEAMLSMMEFAPEQAIEDALSWAEYKALPDELKPFVEKPFSSSADFMLMPICGDPSLGPGEDAYHKLNLNGESYDFTAYGRHAGMETKEGMPLQGIQLDGQSALRTETLQQLDAADHEAVAGDFIVANPDPNFGFYSGQEITGEPVVALGGGQLYYFANVAALNELNTRLAQLDSLNGPHAGSRVLYQAYAEDGAGEGGADWPALAQSAELQASAWTETKKKIFYIRVDFSDEIGASVGQAELADIVNGPVSDNIEEMSYGKTWIEADVSSMVVRMPSPTSTYLPSNNENLRNDAIAAFNALNTGVDLSDYDIVGVHFASIGMSGSAGFAYAGLAGGSRQWLQGTTNSGVIIHEFGHNYGLGHAHYWDTGGASVVGTGSSEEYGNIFDVMGNGPDPEGHFHPQAKQKLNWLESTDWVDADVSGSGTYRIYRGDHESTTGTRGLRVEKGTDTDEFYWVGYRTAINNEYLQKSAVLNWQKSPTGNSWLVDTTPGSTDGKDDSAISLGRTYSDSTAQVHITPVAVGGLM